VCPRLRWLFKASLLTTAARWVRIQTFFSKITNGRRSGHNTLYSLPKKYLKRKNSGGLYNIFLCKLTILSTLTVGVYCSFLSVLDFLPSQPNIALYCLFIYCVHHRRVSHWRSVFENRARGIIGNHRARPVVSVNILLYIVSSALRTRETARDDRECRPGLTVVNWKMTYSWVQMPLGSQLSRPCQARRYRLHAICSYHHS
jgi:hypothetical protein